MRKKLTTIAGIMLTLSMSMILGSCGNTPNSSEVTSQDNKLAAHEPVTLTFFSGTAGTMNEEQFTKYVQEPVQKKYPHITLKFVLSGKGTTINDLVASGETPDLITNGPASIFTYSDLALTGDITPIANKLNFDFNRIEDAQLDFIRAYSNRNGLYSMPFMNGTIVLFYNKDIFDKFGVAYPKDLMTWDQIYDIAKKIVRTDAGVKYRSIEFFALNAYNQLSATYVNPSTKKASFNTQSWKTLFETFDKFYKIPGSEFITTTYADNEKAFLKDRNLAMFVSGFNNVFNGISASEETKKTFNWDMVTLPVFPDQPKLGATPIPNHIMITKTSKYQEDAFRVVETVLSDEVQGMLSRGGIIPVLKKQSIKDEFLKEVDFAKGKNTGAVFKLDRAPARIPSEYDGVVQGILNNLPKDIHSGKKDVNTALRDADDAANKAIEAEKAKSK
ncbi:ABC transporter substrate-binding protein [Paenibacillus sp. GCM10012303]|uniref:ABC transporter substrate-binding protein n=1 Tax=Paenibacillus sp. GCM10012303 TaxID=3317340 RepID=UPI003620AB35